MGSQKNKNSELAKNNSCADFSLDEELGRGFMLGNIIVYPAKDVLVKDNIHHHLSRRAMEVLFALCSNAGSVVSRQALLDCVWGDDNTQDAKLSHAISEIRQTIGDNKDHPLYIQTLPRKGFRLIMPVLPLDDHLLSTAILTFATDGNSTNIKDVNGHKTLGHLARWRHSRLFKVAGTYVVMAWVLMQVVSVTMPIIHAPKWADSFALLVLVICLPLTLFYNWWGELNLRMRFVKQQHNAKSEKQIRQRANQDLLYICGLTFICASISYVLILQILDPPQKPETLYTQNIIQAKVADNGLAVMPFKQVNMGNADYSVEILQSELLTFLSQSSQLLVTAERVVAGLPQNASLSLIRARTGAKYVLEGVVSIVQQQLHVTTTLTDTGTGYQVWANKSVAGLGEHLYLYETLSRQIFNALTFLMPQDESAKVQFKPTDDIQAYDYYVQAKTLLKESYSEEQLKRVVQLFLQALKRDSEFELAEAGLCQTYLEMYGVTKMSQVFELASQVCQKAKGSAGSRAESDIALGQLYYESGEYQQAIQHFTHALELQKNNSKALTGMARAMAMTDSPDKAEKLFLTAIQVEPGYWLNYERYGSFLFSAGRYIEASLQFQKQSVLQPQSEEAFNNLGAAYYLNSEFEKATENWQKALALKPSANLYSNLGTSLFFSQQFSQAAEMYQQALKLKSGDFVVKSNLADAYKYIDKQKDNARRLFTEALEQASASEQINARDPALKAHIAKLNAELGRCKQANLYSQAAQMDSSDDPYIFYWLALAAMKCNDKKDVLHFLNTTIRFGYPYKLLNKDHQFAQYQQDLQLMQQNLASKSL